MQAAKLPILLTLLTAYIIAPNSYSAENTTEYEYIKDITVVDLGTLPGGINSTARDINNDGYIVGSSETKNLYKSRIVDKTTQSKPAYSVFTRHVNKDINLKNIYLVQKRAFVIHGGGMQNLGTLPGGGDSHAYGISDNGYIVGAAYNSNNLKRGFALRYNLMRDLGAYPPEDSIGSSSWAFAVNNDALVAGNIDLAGVIWNLNGIPIFPPFPPHVSVTSPGEFKPAIAYDINNNGQAVGTLLGLGKAFRWSSGNLEELKTLGLFDDDAFGINSHGHVVGQALLAAPVRHHAVVWSAPSTVEDLGTLGGTNSSAQDINDNYTVVGYSETLEGYTQAFIWRRKLGMRSLGTLGGKNSKAFAINADGVIVGESETATGETHATRWTVSICSSDIATDEVATEENCN